MVNKLINEILKFTEQMYYNGRVKGFYINKIGIIFKLQEYLLL